MVDTAEKAIYPHPSIWYKIEPKNSYCQKCGE